MALDAPIAILARREAFVLRSPLPTEARLVKRLDELRLSFRGALPTDWREHLPQLAN